MRFKDAGDKFLLAWVILLAFALGAFVFVGLLGLFRLVSP